MICGFGKGRFKTGPAEGDNEINFNIESADVKAIMDGVCKPLADYLNGKRQSAPDKPPLCYHGASYDTESHTWKVKQEP